MQTPSIIIAEPRPGEYDVSVIGRFGGGYRNMLLDKQGLIARLAHLKSYDCGEQPARVICPESVKTEVAVVFPQVA